MNVTKNEIKDRQLHIEDYLQMVSCYPSNSEGLLSSN